MIVLNNGILEVTLNAKGAEIIKIIGLKDQMNYMWKRDPSLWANSAPILFPIVGAINNNECRINGKTYSMTQHGFARHTEFEVDEQDDSHVIFHLTPNDEIIKQYPFNFHLFVKYTLIDNSLHCECKVINNDDLEMYFQIGGHPAFACPFYDNESSNDYYIEFEKEESLEAKIIDVKNNGMSRKTAPLFDHEKRFFVRQAMFNDNAVVVKNPKSTMISLKSLNHNKAIHFHMNHFNHLGIWTSKHVGGLLAIEPWVGHVDYVGFNGEFKEKEGIVTLQPQQSFECDFTIEIQQ